MKIYLVTGGAGFIGTSFVKYILSIYNDIKIFNIDKLTYAGNLENLKDIENNPNYKFIQVDICDKEAVGKVFNERVDSTITEGLIKYVEDRKSHNRKYGIDPTKIKEELGWEPEICFEVGIEKTIQWFLDNKAWMENVTFGIYIGKIREEF